MFALPGFATRGSDASAASGRYSELSEWQRSIKSSIPRDAMILSGTATGNLSFAVKKHAGGERANRRQRRKQGGERVAAVEKIEDQRKPDDFFGHRNRNPLDKVKAPIFRSRLLCLRYLFSQPVTR